MLIAAANNDATDVGVTTVTFPAKMLWVEDGQETAIFTGTMSGSLAGHADFDLTNTEGLNCVGRAEKSGVVAMTCDGSRVTYQGAPARKAFSGVRYANIGGGLQSAFGWGKGADETLLRKSIREKRDIEAKEARELNPG